MASDNFELSEEQSMILETVRKFAAEQLEPKALELDEHGTFVRDHFDGLAELGMLGIPLPEASGGAELGLVSFVVAMEQLGRACGSTARVVLSQTALCGVALEGHTDAEAISSGQKLGAFVGLDSGIAATDSGDGLTLSGVAPLVTAATEADLLVVAARTADGETVLACLDAAQAQCTAVPALGFRASAPGRVEFQGVTVPAANVLARGATADARLRGVHVAAAVGGAALAIGMADAARMGAAVHAGERIAFGKPLAKQQAVALKLVDSLRATLAARHLVYHAARLADAGREAAESASIAKLAAVDAAVCSADEAIQILGGFGYTVEYHAERYYRDAKTLEVFGHVTEELRNALVPSAMSVALL
ncbi:MAG: acyl-CoA dehydrogenase family protein [Planctomycetes bacterium]|nr:acyl-CoA dehydrogenase family protein [Planctomycetota bacterium]MCB9869844.1 acyl-CoA dehydrogenase family protein [Planctomycetota bacterium]